MAEHFTDRERLRLLLQGLANQAGQLVSVLTGLFLAPLMLRHLGAEFYGFWIFALTTPALVNAIDAGLFWTATRHLASGESDRAGDDCISAIFGGYLTLALLGAVAIVSSGRVFAHHAKFPPAIQAAAPVVFALLSVTFIADRLLSFSMAVFSGMRRFELINLMTSGMTLLRALGLAVLLLQGASLKAIAACFAGASTLAAIVALSIVNRHGLLRLGPALFNFRVLRRHLRFAFCSTLATSAQALAWSFPVLFTGLLKGPTANVSLYLGQRPPFMISEIVWRAAEVLFPAAASNSGHPKFRGRELLLFGTRWVMVCAVPLCTAIFVLAPDVLRVWVGTIAPESVLIMRIVAIGVLADALSVGPLHIMWGQGADTHVMYIIGTQAALTTGLTVALTPRYGPVGTGMAFTIGAVVAGIVAVVVASSRCGCRRIDALCETSRLIAVPWCCFVLTLLAMSCGLARFAWIKLIVSGFVAGLLYIICLYVIARGSDRLIMEEFVAMSSSFTPQIRRKLQGVHALRSSYVLLKSLQDLWVWNSPERVNAWSREQFDAKVDPFNYDEPDEQERLDSAAGLLDSVRSDRPFPQALEIACAEGHFTTHLTSRCTSLLAVDMCDLALNRARKRCPADHIEFRLWDLLRDPMPGEFDVVVVMDVLELIYNPKTFRDLRPKLVAAVRPGGYLLVGNSRQCKVFESALWAKWLIRGGKHINEFIGRHPDLTHLKSESSDLFINSLFHKRA